jgi:hypothetical protein
MFWTKQAYILLHIDDLLDQFNGAKYFIPINLKSRYYQICIVNEDIEKMVMKTRYDAPPNSLIDSIASPKVKTVEG